MTPIFEWFNVLVPFFMTLSFQVLCIISGKIGLSCVSLAFTHPTTITIINIIIMIIKIQDIDFAAITGYISIS